MNGTNLNKGTRIGITKDFPDSDWKIFGGLPTKCYPLLLEEAYGAEVVLGNVMKSITELSGIGELRCGHINRLTAKILKQ